MLKLIYKTLLISVLSCSLMTMDFTSKGIIFSDLRAETVKTDGVKDSDMMATLTMTTVGLLTSRLYTCKLSTDMLVAAAGGAAFVAGEILSTIKLRKVMKDLETEISRDKNGNINREQIAALERLKKSYEEAKATAGTKKMLQKAAAAAFLAAAAIAYTLDSTEKTMFQACKGTLTAEGAACLNLGSVTGPNIGVLQSLELGRLIPKPSATGKATEEANMAAEKAAQATTTATASTLASTYSATCSTVYGSWACPFAKTCAAAPPKVSAACDAIMPTLSQTSGFCPAALSLTASTTNSDYFNMAMTPKNPALMLSMILGNKLFSPAQADLFTPLGIASSAAISFLMMTSKTLGASIDSYLLAPMNRAIIWGVLSGLTFAATASTDNVIRKIEANIMKIDVILNSMNSLAAGATGSQVVRSNAYVQTTIKPNSNLDLSATNYDEVDLSGEVNGSLPCFTSKDSSKCPGFDEVGKNLSGFDSLSADSQQQILGILKTANGFNGTSKITKGSLEGAAKLAGQSAAIQAAYEKARKNASDSLKANKSKISLEEREKQLSAQLEKNIKDGLSNGKTDANSMLASMYGGRVGSSAVAAASSSSEKKPEEEAALKKSAAAATIVDIGGAAAVPTSDVGLGMNESKELSLEKVNAYNEAQKATGVTMDDYDLKANEITKDSSTSIFELISNRYQRTGYQRLFEKVKTQDPTKAQE